MGQRSDTDTLIWVREVIQTFTGSYGKGRFSTEDT